MTGVLGLALAGARAHRVALAGTALTLAAAGAVLAMIGVLLDTGLRGGRGVDGTTLVLLASSFAGTALVVIVLVVAATITLALRGRRQEFALLRTVGATRRQVRQEVALEVLLVALLAVPLGAVVGTVGAQALTSLLVDAGMLGAGGRLSLSPGPAVAALLVLLPTALLGGRLGARETIRTPPTEAVRRSTSAEPGIGRVRRTSALVVGLGGLATALTPVLVPGTIGGATAASSAFLLVGALALAGPLLVRLAFGGAARTAGRRRGPAVRVAVANLLGHSRRLTVVVVPLALALATGTVQTSVDRAVAVAAEQQLRAAIRADLVAGGDLTADRLDRLRALPAGADAVVLGAGAVEVGTDADDGLGWERTALGTVPPRASRTLFDPGVTAGSLAALGATGTVAVSTDEAFESGLGIGRFLPVRAGGREHRLRVVAVYARGLGVGDLLVSPATARAVGADATPSAVLLRAAAEPAVRALGLDAGTPERYIAAATRGAAAQQRVSSVLILLLLVFVGIAAADALVLTTLSRRHELLLLSRIGATRAQLLRTTALEALATGLLAWAFGTLSVVPAVLAASGALVGGPVPVVDLPTYGLLSAAVLVTAMAGTLVPAAIATRGPRAEGAHGRGPGGAALPVGNG